MSAPNLQHELDTLERRLYDGERKIEEANQAGADAPAWTDFWVELLHTYEAVYRRLQDQDERRAA